ncbi:hypothetical protein CC2G_013061 [Coprinopsis cinerea AmutBmut pab1-1]|nr:hypothetical protein CC2G_013061 [Coprinopsis cinerea AmutBmut pab1-1]
MQVHDSSWATSPRYDHLAPLASLVLPADVVLSVSRLYFLNFRTSFRRIHPFLHPCGCSYGLSLLTSREKPTARHEVFVSSPRLHKPILSLYFGFISTSPHLVLSAIAPMILLSSSLWPDSHLLSYRRVDLLDSFEDLL